MAARACGLVSLEPTKVCVHVSVNLLEPLLFSVGSWQLVPLYGAKFVKPEIKEKTVDRLQRSLKIVHLGFVIVGTLKFSLCFLLAMVGRLNLCTVR